MSRAKMKKRGGWRQGWTIAPIVPHWKLTSKYTMAALLPSTLVSVLILSYKLILHAVTEILFTVTVLYWYYLIIAEWFLLLSCSIIVQTWPGNWEQEGYFWGSKVWKSIFILTVSYKCSCCTWWSIVRSVLKSTIATSHYVLSMIHQHD